MAPGRTDFWLRPMSLTPGEHDRLLLFLQGQLARSRKERGLLLNIPESTALIADSVVEMARDGLTLEQTRIQARTVLSVSEVLPEVPQLLTEIRVEARFDDGTRLVVITDPFNVEASPGGKQKIDATMPTATTNEPVITVENTSKTSIGISSHIHLAEVNPRLRLDRSKAYGMRVNAPTGDAIWIAPGESVRIALVPISGSRIMIGNSGVVDGSLDDPVAKARALTLLRECGYLDVSDDVDINPPSRAEGSVGRLIGKLKND